MKIGGCCNVVDGIMQMLTCRLGEVVNIPFWLAKLLGRNSLEIQFPNLYQACINKVVSVRNMGEWSGDN